MSELDDLFGAVKTAPGADLAPSVGATDPFDEIFGKPKPKAPPSLPRAVGSAVADPEAAGKAVQLGKKANVPAAIVEADPETAQQNLRIKQASDAMRNNPAASKYVENDPMAAKVSNDDWETLGKIANHLEDFAIDIPTQAFLNTVDVAKSIFGSFVPKSLGGERDPIKEGFFGGMLKTGGGLLTAVGAPFAPIAGAAHSVLGRPMVAGDELLRQGAVSLFGEGKVANAENIRSGRAGPLSFEEAKHNIDIALMGISAARAPRIMSGGGMTADEFLNTAAGVKSRQEIDDFIKQKEAGATGEQKQLTHQAEVTIRNGEVPHPGVDPIVDKLHIATRDLDAAQFDAAYQLVQNESKTLPRSPDKMADYLGHVVGDKEVYIPADKIIDLYMKRSGDHIQYGAAEDGVFGWIENFHSKMETALSTGGDVAIPLKDFLAHTDPKIYDEVKDSIRFRKEGVTGEEGKELGKVEEPKPIEEPQPLAEGETAPIEPAPPTYEQAAIAAEEKSLYLHQYFDSGKTINITKPEFKKYSDKIEAIQAASEAKVAAAAERYAKRQLTPEWKKNEAEIEAEVRTDLRSRADIAADTYFRTGQLPTGEPQPRVYLDRDTVERMVGESRLRAITKTDGVHPDDIAPKLGFANGAEMLKALDLLDYARAANNETPKAYIDRVAKQETEARMEEKYGSLEKAIQDAAREAALDVKHVDIMAAKLEALAMADGKSVQITRDSLVELAESQFSKLGIKDAASYETFRRDTERAGQNAEKALLSGKFADAFIEKQRQALAHIKARLAREFEKQVSQTGRLIDRLREKEIKGVSPLYTDYIHNILENLGIKTKRQLGELAEGLAQKPPLASFLDTLHEAGLLHEESIPEFVVYGSRRTIDTLSASEFLDLKRMLEQLHHIGRDVQTIIVDGKKADLAEIKKEAIDSLKKRPLRKDLADRGGEKGKLRFGIDTILQKPEELFLDFDFRNPNGPFSRAVIRPWQNAKHAEVDLSNIVSDKLAAVKGNWRWRKSLDDSVANDFFYHPETGELFDLNRGDVLNIALNFGNRSNIGNFVHGYVPKDAPPMAAAVFESKLRKLLNDNLSKEDIEYVNGVWEIFKDLRKREDAVYRDMTGRGLEGIDAEPIKLANGTLDGGYFSIIRDTATSNINSIKDAQFGEQITTRPSTANNYIKRRVEGLNEPINFRTTPEILIGRLAEQIHDITHRRVVSDLSKILLDPKVQKAVRWHVGPEYEAQLRPFLENIANRQRLDKELDLANKLLRGARRTLIVQALGANLSVVLSPAMGKVFSDPAYMAGISRSIAHPMRERALAMEKSKELPRTLENMDRDFNEQFTALSNRNMWSAANKKIAYTAMRPAAFVEKIFRTNTFLTEYRKAIGEGLSEEAAINRGDAAIRHWHGVSTKYDLSPLFRGPEGMKLLTILQGYFNTLYNQTRVLPHNIREGEYGEATHRFIASIVIPALFGAFMFDQYKKEDSYLKRIGKAFLRVPANMIPGVNQGATLALDGYQSNYPFMSVFGGPLHGAQALVDIAQGKATPGAKAKTLINAVGFTFRLPTGQIAKNTQGFLDLNAGRAPAPKNFEEELNFIIKGRARPK